MRHANSCFGFDHKQDVRKIHIMDLGSCIIDYGVIFSQPLPPLARSLFPIPIRTKPKRKNNKKIRPVLHDTARFSTNVQPSALFVELEDAATSAAVAAAAVEAGGRGPTVGGDDRPRSAVVGGFCFGLDTRHVEDAPGVAVIKRHPGGLEPTKRRPLQSQLQVSSMHTIPRVCRQDLQNHNGFLLRAHLARKIPEWTLQHVQVSCLN